MAAADTLSPDQFSDTPRAKPRPMELHVRYSPQWAYPKRARKQINREANRRGKQ